MSVFPALKALARHGHRWAGPGTDPADQTREDGTILGSERSNYDMMRPVRPVPVQGLSDNPPFTVRASVHSQLAHIASPGLLGTPEAVHIPLTGHNLLLSLAATGEDEVVLRTLRAEVTGRLPLRVDGTSFARSRMPDMVLSADLLESAQRAARAYRRLRGPDVAVLLDPSPAPVLAELGANPVLPLAAMPGESAALTCAPVTDDGRWVRWRLTAEIVCAGRVWRPWWDLTVTATTGLAAFSGHAASVPQHVCILYPDHFDPGGPRGQRAAESVADRILGVAAHTSRDGKRLLQMPSRPDPDPEPPGAAEVIRRAASLARAGDLPGAAEIYRSAAEAGSGRAAYLLGRLTQDRGDPDGAVRWYEKAAARRVHASYNNLGMLALLHGDLDAAERWYRRAMDVGDWVAAVGLGIVMEKRGDEVGAEELWRLAGRNVPAAHHNLAVLYQRQGRLREADELFTRAAEAGNAQAAVHVGFRCHEAGDQDGAERWWRTAADAGDAEGAFHLGLLLVREGRAREGERLWERTAERLGTPRQGVTSMPSGRDTGASHRIGGMAESGEVYAAYHLGLLSWEREDHEAALAWWTLAAGAGHLAAVFRLCELHLTVRSDLLECVRWASFGLGLEGVSDRQVDSLAAGLREIAEQLADAADAYEPGAAAEACFVAAEAYRRLTARDGAHRPAWEDSVRHLAALAEWSGSSRARELAAIAEGWLWAAG
ncbi:tetratricopeptide repeat protein [Streptomyces sp. NBC_01618]|uniref:tetratricopeptide repeat protein n=1 Tax=Streptomyces sp. NBC_01618 TaxID=2975900 RepID=UPI00386FD3ED|nr:tetratricopeptide repeat protein [Streptomyces sp. NBC_01618]